MAHSALFKRLSGMKRSHSSSTYNDCDTIDLDNPRPFKRHKSSSCHDQTESIIFDLSKLKVDSDEAQNIIDRIGNKSRLSIHDIMKYDQQITKIINEKNQQLQC